MVGTFKVGTFLVGTFMVGRYIKVFATLLQKLIDQGIDHVTYFLLLSKVFRGYMFHHKIMHHRHK